MADLAMRGVVRLADCADSETMSAQDQRGRYRLPVKAYPTQNLWDLASCLPGFAAGVPRFPGLRLNMYTIRNGYFATDADHAGMIFAEGGAAVREAGLFSLPARQGAAAAAIGPVSETMFDDVFIGFDWGWINWYHWLCFALTRCSLAAGMVPPGCAIILPDHAKAGHAQFSGTSWSQSLAAFGLADRVTIVPPGIYRARTIRFLWTEPGEPTDLTLTDGFASVFQRLQDKFQPDPTSPKRILIARDRSGDPRLPPDEQAILHEVGATHGFVPMHFETMDFQAQARAVFNAEMVMGVHGAGLANCLFGRPSLRLLEVNRQLDLPRPGLRPGFYMLSHARGQRYMMLDRDRGELTAAGLTMAIERLAAPG
jgi:hypothetical protein